MEQENKKLLTFPCQFPIKIVGLRDKKFEQTTFEIICNHVKNLPENALQQRTSKNGKYLSLTVTVPAESQEQLDAIYQDLTDNPLVIMAL